MGSVHMLMIGSTLIGFSIGVLVVLAGLTIFGGEDHEPEEPR
jgi:F0F1-type ATP synthase assembly protein I